MIGGMGPNIFFVWKENSDKIPDGYYFERKDLRGYKIYVQKSNSVLQFTRPEQYTSVVVENPGKWISYYEIEER